MKSVKTVTATIYVGFKEHDSGVVHTLDEARAICQRYVDEVGLCVTLTQLEYIYTGGSEPGCAIGIINYPRYPDSVENIKARALRLAEVFLNEFNQYRISVVFSDETVMIGL